MIALAAHTAAAYLVVVVASRALPPHRFAAGATAVFAALVLTAPAAAIARGRLSRRAVLLAGVAEIVVAGAAVSTLFLVDAGAAGPLLALLLGQGAGAAVALASRDAASPSLASATPPSETRLTLAQVGAAWLLAHLDLLLARHLLAAPEWTAYVAAALPPRLLLFLPAPAVLLSVPAFAAAGIGRHRDLRRATAAASAAALVAAGLIAASRSAMLSASDPASAAAASVVAPLALAAAPLGILAGLTFKHVAFGSRSHRLVLAVAAAQAAVVVVAGPGPLGLALTALGAAAAAGALQYHAAAAICRWAPPLATLRPHEEIPRQRPSASLDGDLELSVVIPCHNAGPGLSRFLTDLEDRLRSVRHEVIVVSDGSTDDTVRTAEAAASDAVRVIHYAERSGKGHALRVGLSLARGEYVAFIDADGDIAPDAIAPSLSLMKLYQPDIVLGSKRHPLSDVRYPPIRRVMSWVYHKLTRVLFRVNVRDTQTGLKLIRRDVLAAVLPRMLEKRFAFDLELLVVARLLGFTRVFEAPVTIDYQFSSHVDPRAAVRIVLDTVAIFYRRHILDTYRRTEGIRSGAGGTPSSRTAGAARSAG